MIDSYSINLFLLPKGKVEVEVELVTKEEAEETPVGKARNEPLPLDKPKYESLFSMQCI